MDSISPVRKIRAPAKLNIRLKVVGRRPDGYHELVSIMVPVRLCDYLELELTRKQRITLECKGLSVPHDEDNLAVRAAKAFMSRSGIEHGLSIRLFKKIPVAAGLGGGSSDAACTLRALNEMCQRPLDFKDLVDLAVQLGADVPFFLLCRPCVARGIGEQLEPIEKWPQFWYVIITPPIRISTAWVYGHLKIKLTTGKDDSIIKTLGQKPIQLSDILENDLETVTGARFSAINRIKEALMNEGAEGALMSGSGPSVFGIFSRKDKALAAKRYMASQNLGGIFVVQGVAENFWGVVKR